MSYKLNATKNYGLFELATFNRDVSKTKKLEASMKQHGYIPAYPLHVTRNGNGKLLIKAGHHRFEVAQRLGLPVFYVICEDTATIHELEGSTILWRLKDYLQSFSRCGMADYQSIADYTERTGIPLVCAISMFGGQSAGSGNFQQAFKAGTYRITDRDHAEQVATIVQRCKAAGFKHATINLFVAAVSRSLRVPSFVAKKFVQRVESHPELLCRQAHLDAYMDMVEMVYNYGSQKKIPLAFMAKQAAQDRLPAPFKRKA
ncbi:MAG: ParB N-terminal domain-containing protein [Methylococcaceae bacterium]|nr:ParB N-terminal domain-containing protein [Methylococcaceae bacterium]